MVDIVSYTTDEAWLAARAQDVTSTDISALWGVNPWKSSLALWREKHEGAVAFEPGPHAEVGTALESAIAGLAMKRLGMAGERYRSYHRDAEIRIGASYDYATEDGAILEVKNVGAGSMSGWGADTMPAHVELQAQVQLMLAPDAPMSRVAALLGGTRLEIYERSLDAALAEKLAKSVQLFWAGQWPPMPGPEDRNEIRMLCRRLRPAHRALDGADARVLKDYMAALKSASRLPSLKNDLRMLALKLGATRMTAGKLVIEIGDL